MHQVEGTPTSTQPALIAQRESSKLAFDRIVYFSDAVFAIAMTVLVLDLVREYQLSGVNSGDCDVRDVYCRLQTVSGLIAGYIVSFGVLGMLWAAHHQIFRSIGRHDFRLIVCNLFHLAFTVGVPFTAFIWGSSLSGIFDQTNWVMLRQSATVYALNLGLASLTLGILWYYASHNNWLTYPDRVRERGAYYTARLWTPTVAFFLCAAIAQIQPIVADVLLVINWLVSIFLLRRILTWTHRFPYLPGNPMPPPPPADDHGASATFPLDQPVQLLPGSSDQLSAESAGRPEVSS